MKKAMGLAVLMAVGFSVPVLADKNIALDELQKHSSEADCWMAIDGMVYDMSPYIKLHREECKKMNVSDLCGADASSVWQKKEGSKSAHKKKSQRELLKAKIGRLSQ